MIETARRPVVLILLGCFWPGNDFSGPNQSFISLARALGDTFEFRVVARDGATGRRRAQEPMSTVGSISASPRRAIGESAVLARSASDG